MTSKNEKQPKQEQRKCDNCGEFGECCQKQEQDEFTMRGTLATLKCWPRLTGDEAADLVAFFAVNQQRKPLTFPEEASAFKEWFDAWWLGDGEQGESIPSQSDPKFSDYVSQYTFGFGAWMAAKHVAQGIRSKA